MNAVNKKKPLVLEMITVGTFGGAQTHLLDIVHNLKDEFEFHVVVGEKGYLGDALRLENIMVHSIPSLQREISIVNDIRAYYDTCRIIRTIQPALVCTHSSKAGFIGRRAAHKLGVPSTFTAHGWAFTDGVDRKRQMLYIQSEKLAAKWCERIICVSEYDRQLALKRGVAPKNQLVTIHNGIPTITYSGNISADRPLNIIMVARFSPQKDHALLLKAVKELANRNMKIQLVGDGPLLADMQVLAQSLGLTDRVEFLGARKDVPELLAQADVFVLTSNWEGFPITILEAMRAGLPVICSDVGGCNEAVINGENGFLIPRGDLSTLVNKLVALIDNRDLRWQMGQAGRTRFEKCFTVDKMIEKTEQVYWEVLEQRRKV